MFYQKDKVESVLCCSFCNRQFSGVVKLIIECGNSICGECYYHLKDELENLPADYTCKACGEVDHLFPARGLPDNKSLMKLVKPAPCERQLRVTKCDEASKLQATNANSLFVHEREHLGKPASLPVEKIKVTDDCLNLLLFGETGVGKSTLINTFANFLAYPTFEDALNGDVKCVIPCDFTMTDSKYNAINIQCGEQNQNEAKGQPAGKSVTQTVKSYFFDVHVNGKVRKLHIIDTPGVGNTQGVVKDKENLQKVIDYIKQYKGLNAICVLLKPNARLTLQFRYCLKELLVQLNKGAAPNLCFCYTNARGTFFRPGEGYPILIQTMKKIEDSAKVKIPLGLKNTFCFDSEPFRYLAARKQNVKFDLTKVESFKESWNKGYEAFYNLVAHAGKLSPAAVKPIFVLNQARNLLMELSKPVAELSRNIQTKKKLVEDKNMELGIISDECDYLQDKLYVDQIDVVTYQLDRPKTVCFNQKCTKLIKIGELQTIIYDSNCHMPCNCLYGIDVDVVGHPGLKSCAAFEYGSKDDCVVCGHHWLEHMHSTKESKEVQVQVLDPNIQKMIDAKKDKKYIIEQAIKSAQDMIKTLQKEHEQIIKACTKLTNYIKENGMMYYNPDLEEYMDLLIREEEQKSKAGASNSKILDGLRQAKYKYFAEIDKLSQRSTNSDEIVTEDDIEKLVSDMCSMKLIGETLSQALSSA